MLIMVLIPSTNFQIHSIFASESNIDSMDVHPANRWTISNTGYTAAVSDGILNLSDVGDASADQFIMYRGLRDLEGVIEILFNWDVNASTDSYDESVEIVLTDSGQSEYVKLMLSKPLGNDYFGRTILKFTTVDGDKQVILSGNEQMHDD